MIVQHTLNLGPYPRGFHLVTTEILKHIGRLPATGLLHVFIQHTSAGLIINENADPDVLIDFGLYFDTLAPEHLPGMRHTREGPDDMPAHIKAALTGASVSIPITDNKLNLGTWQGIYLCEFRNHARRRSIVVTIYS
ncbi:MAG TPA: secondary thiamine-phosphate synthase enzyme YjbQ [Saprospiraceae bacterium]|nr:secondary thiamine-phosphate synthase enzyme YjbQ [Saprospiraceae bacterium]